MGRANCSNESACFTIAYSRVGLTPEQMEFENESIENMARSADRRISSQAAAAIQRPVDA